MEVIEKITGNHPQQLQAFTHIFFCEGCQTHHGVIQGKWTFDENYTHPTISPSILVNWVKYDVVDEKMVNVKDMVCHSFVKAGMIQYLADCTHKYAGQTLRLTSIED